MISATLATALFPVIARQYARGRPYKAFRTARTWSMFIVAGGMVPLAAFALWDQEIVALVFQRGAFGPDAVRMTAQVVPILAITSLLTGVSGIQMRLLLTQGNVRVVSSVAILVVVAKIGLNALLVPYFGLPGVAIATVIAMTGAVSTRFFYSWRFAKRDQTKRDAERASQAGAPDRERTSPADASEPHQTEEDDA